MEQMVTNCEKYLKWIPKNRKDLNDGYPIGHKIPIAPWTKLQNLPFDIFTLDDNTYMVADYTSKFPMLWCL